jgi:DNA-binding NarL/FixJ family response regulator
VAITDVCMPPGYGDDGLVAAAEICRSRPSVAVVVLTQHIGLAYVLELVRDDAAGVGHLLKDRVRDVGEFREAVARVAAFWTAVDPEGVSTLVGARRRS